MPWQWPAEKMVGRNMQGILEACSIMLHHSAPLYKWGEGVQVRIGSVYWYNFWENNFFFSPNLQTDLSFPQNLISNDVCANTISPKITMYVLVLTWIHYDLRTDIEALEGALIDWINTCYLHWEPMTQTLEETSTEFVTERFEYTWIYPEWNLHFRTMLYHVLQRCSMHII